MSQEHPALDSFTKPLPGRFAVYSIVFLAVAPIIGWAYWASTKDRIVDNRVFTKTGGEWITVTQPGIGVVGGALVTVLVATANELRIRHRNRTNPASPTHLT